MGLLKFDISKKIKRNIKKLIYHTSLWKYVEYINYIICFQDSKEKSVSWGEENEDKIFYIITEAKEKITGLGGLYIDVKKECSYAESKGYIPIVSFKLGGNPYSKIDVEGISEPWNVFFEPVSEYSINDIKDSKNIIFSGWTREKIFSKRVTGSKGEKDNFTIAMQHFNAFGKRIETSQYIKKLSESKLKGLIGEKTLGVFVRGTDYVAQKPVNHYIQPTKEQLMLKIDEFVKKHNITNIFLVTEDSLVERYIEDVAMVPVTTIHQKQFDNYDYKGMSYLSEYVNENDILKVNTDYLIKLVGLSKCNYLVSSLATGIFIANSIKNKEYKDSYYFELGRY